MIKEVTLSGNYSLETEYPNLASLDRSSILSDNVLYIDNRSVKLVDNDQYTKFESITDEMANAVNNISDDVITMEWLTQNDYEMLKQLILQINYDIETGKI